MVPAVEAKHLDTPRLVADDTQKTVWRWEQQEPFGVNAANEDPDNDTVAFEFNLRFPGQYFDKETNAHYNYFRDYDPTIGRYMQSDPIGLRGGTATYSYVLSSPLNGIDPRGLRTVPNRGGVAREIARQVCRGVRTADDSLERAGKTAKEEFDRNEQRIKQAFDKEVENCIEDFQGHHDECRLRNCLEAAWDEARRRYEENRRNYPRTSSGQGPPGGGIGTTICRGLGF